MNSSDEDITRLSGVKLLLGKVLRIRQGGLLWIGTPCKSWVALSRSFTKRSIIQPAGPGKQYTTEAQRRYLDEHNTIAEVTALFIRTAAALCFYFVIEQPVSSLLFKYDAVARALAAVQAQTVPFHMSAMEGECPKPLLFKGISSFLQTFREVFFQRRAQHVVKPTQRLTTRTTNMSGKVGFQGFPKL